jgi:peroxiredoxin
LFKRGAKIAILGALGGAAFYAAYIIFLLPGGARAFLAKRKDFDQLYVYHVGEQYLDISFTRLDGKSTHLSDFPHKVVLLNFFAGWFRACNAEAPRLEHAWRTYRGRGLVTLAIDVNESSDEAQAFRFKHHLTFPVLLVPNRIEGGFEVPFNLVIDQGGVVRFSGFGSQPDKIENVIAGLLGDGSVSEVIVGTK